MKSAYELAMERLNKVAPTVTLTDAQKHEIADLESEYKAKFADREIFLQRELQKAMEKGDGEACEQLERQLIADRKNFQADLEEKKEAVRAKSNPAAARDRKNKR